MFMDITLLRSGSVSLVDGEPNRQSAVMENTR